MAGVINPVTYVRSAGTFHGPSWGGSTLLTGSEMTINIPAVEAGDVNPCLIFMFNGRDWRTGSSNCFVFYTDSAKSSVDTDWNIVYNYVGANECLAVYYKTNPSVSAAYSAELVHDGTGGTVGMFNVGVYDNVRQVPSCDVVVPATDVQAALSAATTHAYTVTNYSSDVAWGYLACGWENRDNQYGIDSNTDMTDIYNALWVQSADTNQGAGVYMGGWTTGDTTTYAIVMDPPTGNTLSAVFQIYPYEVELTAVDGTIEFSSAFDWGRASVMVLDTFEGLLEFASNETLKFFRTFESVIQFSSTIGKKTSKFFSGVLLLLGEQLDWRFLYQKVKYTIRMWMGSAEQDIESEIRMGVGSITSTDYGDGDQPLKASIRMPWDDPTRR